jgi:hypothetical protein
MFVHSSAPAVPERYITALKAQARAPLPLAVRPMRQRRARQRDKSLPAQRQHAVPNHAQPRPRRLEPHAEPDEAPTQPTEEAAAAPLGLSFLDPHERAAAEAAQAAPKEWRTLGLNVLETQLKYLAAA